MIHVTPLAAKTRADYFGSGRATPNNGRVTFPLPPIDFSRKPILKVTVADLNGSGTILGLIDAKGVWKKSAESGQGTTAIDLATVIPGNGLQNLTLTLDPVTRYGSFVRIRSVKVCYP
jgi:hypothetical protein